MALSGQVPGEVLFKFLLACMSVCLSVGELIKYSTDLHAVCTRGLSRVEETSMIYDPDQMRITRICMRCASGQGTIHPGLQLRLYYGTRWYFDNIVIEGSP